MIPPGSIDIGSPTVLLTHDYSETFAYELAPDLSNTLYYTYTAPADGTIRLDSRESTLLDGTQAPGSPYVSLYPASGVDYDAAVPVGDTSDFRADYAFHMHAGDTAVFIVYGIPAFDTTTYEATFGPMNLILRVSDFLPDSDNIPEPIVQKYSTSFDADGASSGDHLTDESNAFPLGWSTDSGGSPDLVNGPMIQYDNTHAHSGELSISHVPVGDEGEHNLPFDSYQRVGFQSLDHPENVWDNVNAYDPWAYSVFTRTLLAREWSMWVYVDDLDQGPEGGWFELGGWQPHNQNGMVYTQMVSDGDAVGRPTRELWVSHNYGDPDDPPYVTGFVAPTGWFRVRFIANLEDNTTTVQFYTPGGSDPEIGVLAYEHPPIDGIWVDTSPFPAYASHFHVYGKDYSAGDGSPDYVAPSQWYDDVSTTITYAHELDVPELWDIVFPVSGIAGLQDINRARFTD